MFPVKALLEKRRGRYLVSWESGGTTWEPKFYVNSNLAKAFEAHHTGYGPGIDCVLRKRRKGRNMQLRVKWRGRPTEEAEWIGLDKVDSKYLHATKLY